MPRDRGSGSRHGGGASGSARVQCTAAFAPQENYQSDHHESETADRSDYFSTRGQPARDVDQPTCDITREFRAANWKSADKAEHRRDQRQRKQCEK